MNKDGQHQVGYKTDSFNKLLKDNHVELMDIHTKPVDNTNVVGQPERVDGSMYHGAPHSSETINKGDNTHTHSDTTSQTSQPGGGSTKSREDVYTSMASSHAYNKDQGSQDQMYRGKRSGNSLLDKRKWASSISAWGKRGGSLLHDGGFDEKNPEEVKKWSSSFNAWGKRNSDSGYAKKWGHMDAWGKRADNVLDDWTGHMNYEKNVKRWPHAMEAWGKRDSDIVGEYDKKWSNKMNAWGKRDGVTSGDEDDGNLESWADDVLANEKKWAKGMDAWGKRADDLSYNKKWSTPLNSWGKRDDTMSGNSDIEKRWAKPMNAWGKRDDSAVEVMESQKKWARPMNAWGKRGEILDDYGRMLSPENAWGKNDMSWYHKPHNEKRWAKSISAWGKRWPTTGSAWVEQNDKNWRKKSFGDSLDNNMLRGRSSSFSSEGNKQSLGFLNSFNDIEQIQDALEESDDVQRERRESITNSRQEMARSKSRQYAESPISTDAFIPGKRSWEPSSHYWKKRTNFPFFGGPKRGWRGHELNSWGKRSWQAFNTLGKRQGSSDLTYKYTGANFGKMR